MADEYEVPVKVVDRRWWARGEDAPATEAAGGKPSYVEELEQRLAERDRQVQHALQQLKSAIERVFSPEFRNRLDAIVNFRSLSADVMETIVDKFIIQLEEQLAERRIAITLQSEARKYLARKGYDPVFGARPLARVIQTEVRDRLTDEILFGALESGGTVTIGMAGDQLTFTFAPQ